MDITFNKRPESDPAWSSHILIDSVSVVDDQPVGNESQAADDEKGPVFWDLIMDLICLWGFGIPVFTIMCGISRWA